MLPEYVVKVHLASGKLIRVLSDYSSASVDISVVYTERDHVAPKIRALLDFITDKFRS